VLPYDGIHHIDMHMKLLDEETLLLGEYPPGISDGPQIEANLAWLQANYNSVYGTPYRIVRIPMPSNATGTSWPSTGAYYRTYTNGVFVNKTFIYPTYYTQYDTIADRILREALPGYKLVGIDSDDGGSQSPIAASGSIHCITSNIWVADPLLISHQRLRDTDDLGPYQVDALIQHRTGIASATLYHTTDTSSGYTPVPMTLTNTVNHTWTGSIPAYPAGSEVFYYIGATSVSNKTQVRPITAPDGFWKFDISVIANIPHSERTMTAGLGTPYPNPARAITCVPVEAEGFINCNLSLYDINGRLVETLHEGQLQPGTNNFFFNAMNMEAGVYFLRLETDHDVQAKRVLVYGY
jgi:agmatine deiminase